MKALPLLETYCERCRKRPARFVVDTVFTCGYCRAGVLRRLEKEAHVVGKANSADLGGRLVCDGGA